MIRAHNNANILSLGARVVGEGLAIDIVEAYLNAAFEGGRHGTRVDMITALEADRQPRSLRKQVVSGKAGSHPARRSHHSS